MSYQSEKDGPPQKNAGGRRLSVVDFLKRKQKGPPLVMLTAYDVASARTCEDAGVDALLVGDSLGNVIQGHDTTLQVTVDDIVYHTRAVGRARKHALLIADMPWMSYHLSPQDALQNAARMVREGGADAVKLEGGIKRLPVIAAILDAEIPVMGHLGLTPQSVLPMGGFRVQGKTDSAADLMVEEAQALAKAGVFGIVLEGIPGALATRITSSVDVPTIGIGAGIGCDGQVLVYHDLLGMLPDRPPKFVRRYADIYENQVEALRRFVGDVRDGAFPSDKETYK
jgi:3-methyl-2-oxobutanoate hydroxymethyltransferase